MAQSERTRGNKPPVTDYKIGNGGIRDLFKYIMGSSSIRDSMKVVKTRNGKSTVIKSGEQKALIGDKVRAVAGNSNAISAMAGKRARDIQRNMAATMNQRVEPDRITGADQTDRMRMMATYPDAVQDGTATVDSVTVEDLPVNIRASEGPMKVRPHRGYDRLAMQGENVVGRSGRPRRRSPVESYQRGVPRSETMSPEELELERRMREDPDFFYGGGPETRIYGRDRSDIFMTPPGGGMAYGGKVSTPKKKRKKRLSKGGKVTSYNY